MLRPKVLVVDDSALVRRVLSELITADPGLELVGAAADPFEAVRIMRQVAPDVIVLDVQMPRMDGLTFLRKLMAQAPIPTIVLSSFVADGSSMALDALEAGAVEVVEKPDLTGADADRLLGLIRVAARARVGSRSANAHSIAPLQRAPRPKHTLSEVLGPLRRRAGLDSGQSLLAVGASTGGTEALRELIEQLPANTPPMLVVQHMPAGFVAPFAARLDQLGRVRVRVAGDGELLEDGTVLVAPGSHHLGVRRAGGRLRTELRDLPPINRHKPSVDVLFRSAAEEVGASTVGVLLTGMGDDGARGLKELREVGAHTIAQDEATCVVFGMPKEAIELGAAVEVLPLPRVATAALAACNTRQRLPRSMSR